MAKDIIDSKGAKWKIYQLRLTLDGGATFTVDLNLADGDKVDCWYNTENRRQAEVLILKSEPEIILFIHRRQRLRPRVVILPDRLPTFSAAQANGTSYRLVFHNNLADKIRRKPSLQK